MTFNDSDNKDNESDYGEHPIIHQNESPPMGIIERNMKLGDNHTFSFDSIVNLEKNHNFSSNNLPFIPRKQSLTNPFDKFCGDVPHNMDLLNEHGRSRGVSSVLSPYNIPSNFPNIVSPSPIRGTPLNNIASEFKSGGFTMRKMSTNQNGEDNSDNNLLNLMKQSFKDWNNKPKRKETEEIDFSGQDNPILTILNKGNGNNEKKSNNLEILSSSILSPNYKPRSLSINSNGWSLPPHSQIQARKNNSGWDLSQKEKSNGNTNNETRRN